MAGATDIEIPDGDEEFVLDTAESLPVDADTVLAPVTVESMAIDEEGRPRFAPSRDIVRVPELLILMGYADRMNFRIPSLVSKLEKFPSRLTE